MLEIPGEEAPTDPGLEARLRQQAEDQKQQKRARSRSRALLVAGVCMLALAGAGGWWQVQKEAEARVYELDDVYMAPRDGLIAAVEKPATGPQAGVAPVKAPGSGKRPSKNPLDTVPAGSGDPLHTVSESGSAAGPASVKFVPGAPSGDITVGVGAGATASSSLGGVDIAIKRVNSTVLEDDEAILKMAKSVTGAYAPQIETCVQQRMKADPEFAGGWRVNFTIGTEGNVKGLKVAPLDKGDAELEACMTRAISSWRFERIAHEFKVAKNYRYSAASW